MWFDDHLTSLDKAFRSERLHHGIAIFGNGGVGEVEFAQMLSNYLLCENSKAASACKHCKACNLFAAGTHPDKLEVMPNNGSIGIEAIRAITPFCQTSSALGYNKVVVVRHADSMTLAAANALLKTLEEPAENCYILLVSQSKNTLPATVLSRCLLLDLIVTKDHGRAFLAEHFGQALLDKPWSEFFYQQPMRLYQDEFANFEQIDFIYSACLSICEGRITVQDTEKLIDILKQNLDYMASFTDFCLSYTSTMLGAKRLHFIEYSKRVSLIRDLEVTVANITGINITLQLQSFINQIK